MFCIIRNNVGTLSKQCDHTERSEAQLVATLLSFPEIRVQIQQGQKIQERKSAFLVSEQLSDAKGK